MLVNGEENVGVKMARETLQRGIEEEQEKNETKKRPYRAGQTHRKRCSGCKELYPRGRIIDGLCPSCINSKPHKKNTTAIMKSNHDSIPMKKCFFCEGNSFHIFQVRIIQCTQCTAQFRKEAE
jgi:hypothetical protein